MKKQNKRFDFKIYYSKNIKKTLEIADKLGLAGVCIIFHKENVAEAQKLKTKNTHLQILKGLEIEINTPNDIQIDRFTKDIDLVFAKIKNKNLVLNALKSRKIQVLNLDEVPIEQGYLRIAKDTHKFIELCFKTMQNDIKMLKKYKKTIEIAKRKHFDFGILFTSGASDWNEILGEKEAAAIVSILLKAHPSQISKIISGENLLKMFDETYLMDGVEIIA